MTETTTTAPHCPRDGTAMEPLGRGRGAWRCPICRGVFLDTTAMRAMRRGGLPAWAPAVMSVLMSVVVTLVVRRLRRREPA